MHLTNLLPLALSVSAFLVPAEVVENVSLVGQLPVNSNRETVQLECPGCPVALPSKDSVPHAWSKALNPTTPELSTLEVNLVVDQGGVVLFNGKPIWPPGASPPLSVKQTIPGTSSRPTFQGLIPISTSVEYKESEVLVSEADHMTIHPIFIEILALGDEVVHAESVEIRVAETSHGIGLLPSRIRAYESSPYVDSCTTVWCRVKGTIAKKFNELAHAATKKVNSWRGGCAGRKGQPGSIKNGLHLKGGPAKFGPGSTLGKHLYPEGHHGTEGHHKMGHHGHPGHHRHHGHGIRGFIRMFIRTIFLPAFFGLSAGLVLGAFTWLVVTQIRRMRAARRGEYMVVEQVEEGRASMDGLPPKYDEVYREATVEDEKKDVAQ